MDPSGDKTLTLGVLKVGPEESQMQGARAGGRENEIVKGGDSKEMRMEEKMCTQEGLLGRYGKIWREEEKHQSDLVCKGAP